MSVEVGHRIEATQCAAGAETVSLSAPPPVVGDFPPVPPELALCGGFEVAQLDTPTVKVPATRTSTISILAFLMTSLRVLHMNTRFA
jgi:hypothetical protein